MTLQSWILTLEVLDLKISVLNLTSGSGHDRATVLVEATGQDYHPLR